LQILICLTLVQQWAMVVQMVIFTEAEMLSKAWMATASLLWLVLYVAGTFYLQNAEPATIGLQE
jgi:hypothetical protein